MSGALERLKALAEAKRNGQSAVSSSDNSVVSNPHLVDGSLRDGNNTAPVDGTQLPNPSVGSDIHNQSAESDTSQNLPVGDNNSSVDSSSSNSGLPSDHPIKMKLAELEAALLQKLPEFKTILRDIHAKLRQDPAIVTALSPEEVNIVVSGLMHHAQVEVLAPRAVKSAKKAAKGPISAGDL